MKKKKLWITICVCVFVAAILAFAIFWGVKPFQSHLAEPGYQEAPNSANPYAKDVTIERLITMPEKYDGQLVRVIGIGNIAFEGDCISLSPEDLKNGVGMSIWIELGEKAISYEEAEEFNGEYVVIEGIFDKDYRGHRALYHGSIRNISRYELWNAYLTSHLIITRQADFTYSYEVTSYDGQVLASVDHMPREPHKHYVSPDVIGISIQAGTGLITNYATYFDLENGRVSETFYYVLTAKGDYVVCGDYNDGEPIIIVQNIFDKELYYKEYKLENVSPVASDFALDASFDTDGNINITYLSGDDYTKTNYSIIMPPKTKAE